MTALKRATLRIARPTDELESVVEFYVNGLGFERLGGFKDHEGFDGVMVGFPGCPYHLEFVCERGQRAGRAPGGDNLLVFYVPDHDAWRAVIDRMISEGHAPVSSHNPYWDRNCRTFEDPDGYRVVIENSDWAK